MDLGFWFYLFSLPATCALIMSPSLTKAFWSLIYSLCGHCGFRPKINNLHQSVKTNMRKVETLYYEKISSLPLLPKSTHLKDISLITSFENDPQWNQNHSNIVLI